MKRSVTVQIPLAIWKEDAQYVAYTPALETSSCGQTEKEALKNFAEAVDLFFETAEQRKVLRDLLESLGWTLHANLWESHRQPIEGSRAMEIQVPLPQAA